MPSAWPQVRLPFNWPRPASPLRQPPLSCTCSPAINACNDRSSRLAGSSAPLTSPPLSIRLPLTCGASKVPDSRPLPLSCPARRSTIGTNGRATDRSRPARRKSPDSGLFLPSGSRRVLTFSSPRRSPRNARRVSMRLGASVLSRRRAWYGKSTQRSLSRTRRVPPLASTTMLPLGPLAGMSRLMSALSRPCQAKSFGSHWARLSSGNCLRW
ncbi:hypothetical protein D3C75_566740 [compost metagenome]